jgi:hypothetical protein
MEHKIRQCSKEWHELRQQVPLTASQFGDAVGVGKGKPFHFFESLVEKINGTEIDDDTSIDSVDQQTEFMQHGLKLEKVIKEAYELLTGNLKAHYH